MTVLWTPHRFSGGTLALDVANTVVLRHDAKRTFDRFDDIAEMVRFADAASVNRRGEIGGKTLWADGTPAMGAKVLSLRETTDRLFRDAAANGRLDLTHLSPFLSACADGLKGTGLGIDFTGQFEDSPREPIRFEAALAVSALALLQPKRTERVRICANCWWLFLDESRNGSRVWCDMAVCGNRQKAKRHYRRRTERERSHG